jgi:asparagine synthase (glutamine-hydrolysing)
VSAIFGLLGEPGSAIDAAELVAMQGALQHWAPDAVGTWSEGPIGLGCLSLHSTEESVGETQPLKHFESGIRLVADVRLDNREELLETLGVAASEGRRTSDAALVLLAYLKWGEDCVLHLIGDFAFAVWDRRTNSLLCARDQVGIRPLYFHRATHGFAFASEMRGLRALAGVGRKVNDDWIAGFIAKVQPDGASTFYADIERLPPGHRAIVSSGSVRIERFWDLDIHRELRLPSDAEYEEAFREKVLRAIRARIRCHGQVASEFSGGLDSSSVTCLATALSPGSLRSFTFVLPPGREAGSITDTRSLVTDISRALGITPTFLWGEGYGLLPELGHLHDEPLKLSFPIVAEELFGAASEGGAAVLLSGMGGDDLITSQVSGYHEELLTTLQGRELWRSLLTETGTVRKSLTSFARVIRRALFDPNRRPAAALDLDRIGMARDFARDHRIDSRFFLRQNDLRRGSVRSRQRGRILEAGLQPHFEACSLVARHFKLDRRYPLLDVRLLEFGLALPLSQKVRAGLKRRIFRRSLAGLVPATLLDVDRKSIPTMPSYLIRIADSSADWIRALAAIPRSHAVRSYLDVPLVIHTFHETLKANIPSRGVVRAARTTILLAQALDRLHNPR